ncbi:NDR1/HIN1-like protein 6 [Cucurbita maxima]|uniref:NDR1/HIN1-like protein 6 n=1 Tax=Cucurbita maxima TaxID=3661 RepID=A0A6J1I215_CUCMA|nr:NDR1/HIN1-like protein 6 [Cucurbita maxima]
MDTAPKPKYVMLSDNHQGSLRPPPYRRHVPRYHSKAQGGGGGCAGCCLKCICCCYCFLLFLIFSLFGLAYVLFSYYNPQIPSYEVSSFNVRVFDVKPDFSLYTEFIVIVTADNPNQNIDFVYGKGSYVSVLYNQSVLCTGDIPNFRQPSKNVTDISISLTGNSEFGSGLQEALMQNRHSGRIPLLVVVKVPVTIVIGRLSLKKVNVFVNCSLIVDNLSPDKKVGILSSNYTYGAAL